MCLAQEGGRCGSLSVDADGIAHADLEVGASEVVLADIQVRHSRLAQGVRELAPGVKRDLEVLANIQRPDPPVAQHLCQVLQLAVQHSLHIVKQPIPLSNCENAGGTSA